MGLSLKFRRHPSEISVTVAHNEGAVPLLRPWVPTDEIFFSEAAMDEIIREKEFWQKQLLEAVSQLSTEEQHALWKLMVHRGLIQPKGP